MRRDVLACPRLGSSIPGPAAAKQAMIVSMLDLRVSPGQGILIETPSGDVEVWAVDVQPEASRATLEVVMPEDWEQPSYTAGYNLHEEFNLAVPDGEIRIKLLRFRPRPGGTGGSVALGIDAPRSWPVSK